MTADGITLLLARVNYVGRERLSSEESEIKELSLSHLFVPLPCLTYTCDFWPHLHDSVLHWCIYNKIFCIYDES